MAEVVHGGRLDAAVEKYGGEKSKWLDLSTGINPNSWKIPELENELWTQLPDADLYKRCTDAARQVFGVPDDAHISLASGSQMHIQNLPRLFKPQPVALVGFSYQEHGICWQREGHEVYVTDGLKSAEATARIVVVVNPNNPDGRIFDRDTLAALARRLGAKGGLLVVDEAFGDVAPNSCVAEQAGREGLVVLRSLGKFYGLAGVRLGAALTNPVLGQRLDEQLGPWAVSGPALRIGATAWSDTKWQNKTLKKLQSLREELETVLQENSMNVIGGTSLFVLSSHDDAAGLAEHLAKKHILVRQFPGQTNWLRFGVVGKKSSLNRLGKALASFGT